MIMPQIRIKAALTFMPKYRDCPAPEIASDPKKILAMRGFSSGYINAMGRVKTPTTMGNRRNIRSANVRLH